MPNPHAFAGDPIELPSSIVSLGASSFYGCTSLKEVKLSSGLTSLSPSCFDACSSLSSISLHEGLLSLDRNCFKDCTKLTSITLPATLKIIGDNCFSGNTLREIKCKSSIIPIASWGDKDDWNIFSASTCILYVRKELVEDFKKDNNWKCFRFIFALDEKPTAKFETINGVEFILDTQKQEAIVASLKTEDNEITIQNKVSYENKNYIVIGLSDECFSGKNFSSINLPATITFVGKGCFKNCNSLQEISIPESVKILPNLCFSGCYYLRNVELPTSLDSIGHWCFFNCQNLEKINLPEGIRTIPHQGFSGAKFVNITFPASTNLVFGTALQSWGKLEKLTCLAKEPPTVRGNFINNMNSDVLENCILYVPEESVDKYKSAKGWEEFYNIQALESTEIKNHVEDSFSYHIHDGIITISGIKKQEKILIYNTKGMLLSTIYAQNGQAIYHLPSNEVLIIRYGKHSCKILR